MLIAQAFGEYVALGAIVEGLQQAYARLEYALGQWGSKGVIALVAAAVVWRIIERFK
jgi:hypothetical protein